MTDDYMSSADVARLLGVDRSAIRQWRRRYSDFPEPDVTIGLNRQKAVPGWSPGRIDEIRAWAASGRDSSKEE